MADIWVKYLIFIIHKKNRHSCEGRNLGRLKIDSCLRRSDESVICDKNIQQHVMISREFRLQLKRIRIQKKLPWQFEVAYRL